MPQGELSRLLVRPVLEVAPALLGAHLRRLTPDGAITVRLTEVEAYAGSDDPGSHAFRGLTPRTEVMFGPAGRLYVYLSYGMHWCANVVTGTQGAASAVLLRAGEVVEGFDLAMANRPTARRDHDLARGPARLTKAMGIGKADNGCDLLGGERAGGPSGSRAVESGTAGSRGCAPVAGTSWTGTSGTSRSVLRSSDIAGVQPDPQRVGEIRLLLASDVVGPGSVRSGPRVGVSGAGGDAGAYSWRFWIDTDPSVSTYRPGRRAPG